MKYQDSEPHAPRIELIDSMELLLSGARSGQMVGIVYAAVFKRGRYLTDINGSCARHLTHTRGMLMSLNDEIGLLIAHRDPANTR